MEDSKDVTLQGETSNEYQLFCASLESLQRVTRALVCRALARLEGIFCGVSSGGAVSAALRLSSEVENAVIAVIICDRGDRYLSTGIFSAKAMEDDPQPCPAREYPSAVARLPAFPAPRYVIFVGEKTETKRRK